MGVYKRGNIWWIRYKGVDGLIQYESSDSLKKRDAEVLYNKRKADVAQGKDTKPVRMANLTLGEFAPKYLEWSQKQKAFHDKKNIVQMLVALFGNIQLNQFNTMIVEQYQTNMLNQGLAPATANRRLTILKHIFKKAVEWELMRQELRDKISKVTILKEHNTRLRYLSVEGCQSLIEACVYHLKPIVITALNTGMRKGEILSLEWDKNIDLKHGFILLEDTKNGSRREIPINETLRATLQGLTRRLDSPFVFSNGNGKKYGDIKKSFATACKKAGIKNFNFHDLRHTFASQLVMAGIDITTVRELLGHQTLP